MLSSLLSFRTTLEPGRPSFMPTQIIVVPAEVWMALGGKSLKRVIATIRGQALRLGLLLPLEGGGRYLMLNKDVCRAVDIALDQELEVELEPDPNSDHIDLPDELSVIEA